MGVSIERIIETRIQEAAAAGAFRNLPGEGRPLVISQEDELAGDNRLGYKLLRDNGLLPSWLMLAREIEAEQEALARLDERHERLCATARLGRDWERFMPAIERLRREAEGAARQLRRKQDRFNHEAPSIRLERPGLWVERYMERFDCRVSSEIGGEGAS